MSYHPTRSVPRAPVNFGTAVVTCLRKAVRARGRASRAEFWYFVLFTVLVVVAAHVLGRLVGGAEGAMGFASLALLLLIVPLVAAGMRRLHDIGRSGGWCVLLPGPTCLILLILWTEPSQPHANRFGPG